MVAKYQLQGVNKESPSNYQN